MPTRAGSGVFFLLKKKKKDQFVNTTTQAWGRDGGCPEDISGWETELCFQTLVLCSLQEIVSYLYVYGSPVHAILSAFF